MSDVEKTKCVDIWGSAIVEQRKLGKIVFICYSIHKEFLRFPFNSINLLLKYSHSKKYAFLYFSNLLPFNNMIETIYTGNTYYKKQRGQSIF